MDLKIYVTELHSESLCGDLVTWTGGKWLEVLSYALYKQLFNEICLFLDIAYNFLLSDKNNRRRLYNLCIINQK